MSMKRLKLRFKKKRSQSKLARKVLKENLILTSVKLIPMFMKFNCPVSHNLMIIFNLVLLFTAGNAMLLSTNLVAFKLKTKEIHYNGGVSSVTIATVTFQTK